MINFLTPPIFDDEDKTLVAHHLFIIIWTFMAVGWLALFIAVIIPETVYRWLLVVGVIESTGLILLALNKYGHTRLVGNSLIFITWVLATGMALTGGGISSNAMTLYFVVVLIAGLVQSGTAGVITAVLCSLTGLFLVYLEYSGALPVNRVSHTPLTEWIANTIYMAIIISLQYLVSRTIRRALKQSREELKERQRADAALRESEERFRTLVEQAAVGVAEIEMSTGRFFTVNRRLCEMVGRTEEELLATTFQAITHPRDILLHEEKTALLVAGKIEDYSLEKRYLRKDGESVWVNITVAPLWKPGEAPGRYITVVEDITARKQIEEELRRTHDVTVRLAEEMAIIAEIGRVVGSTLNLSEVYERVDAEVRKLIPCDRFLVNLKMPDSQFLVLYSSGIDNIKRIVGNLYPSQGSTTGVVINTHTGLLIQPTDAEEIKDLYPNLYESFKAGLRSTITVPLISMDEVIGSMNFRSEKLKAYTERDLRLAEKIGMQIAGAIANAQLFARLKEAAQELKESEQRYQELSIIDDLTQLYNSRHFYFQLKIELDRSNRYGHPLTLLLLDLDDFKAFNDAYGHVEGDQVLMRLGRVVKRCLRETDFAYRYGGEEFTILLPMTTSAEGAVTAERIRTEFKKETFSPMLGQGVHVTVSIGLAQYKPQEEMKAFVHRVDQLMYQGKENGKDRVSY